MKYSEEALKRLLGQVRHEGLARQTGSPSDEEISTAQLAGLAAHHIPCLVHELREAEAQAAQLLRDNEALRQRVGTVEAQGLVLLAQARQELAEQCTIAKAHKLVSTAHMAKAQRAIALLMEFPEYEEAAALLDAFTAATPMPPHEQPTPPQAQGERAGLGGSETKGGDRG